MGKNPSPFYDNYESMRRSVSRSTIYGCFKNILGSSVDRETTVLRTKRRLIRQIGDALMTEKAVGVENDRYTNDLHVLKNTYKDRKASDIRLVVYFVILNELSSSPKTRAELFEKLEEAGLSNESIYKTRDIMKNEGIIACDNGCFSLTPDIFADMDEDDLFSLYCAAGVFAMKAPFAVPGLFLQDTISLYQKTPLTAPFVYQHYFPHHIANDDQAHILLDAILGQRQVILRSGDGEAEKVTPLKLLYNCQSGVQKVLVMSNGVKRQEFLDDISVKDCPDAAETVTSPAAVANAPKNKPKYIRASFHGCRGYRRLFFRRRTVAKDVLLINYELDRNRCLRFAGYVRLEDESAAEDHRAVLEKMLALNTAQRFEEPVKFEFTGDAAGKMEMRSNECFEMMSKNRLIELMLSNEENSGYDDFIDSLYECFEEHGIRDIDFETIPVRTTALEREFIGMLLTDEQSCTLLTDNCRRLLSERITAVDYRRGFDVRFAEWEKVPSRETMQLILDAIKRHIRISYTNVTSKGTVSGTALPYKLLYSTRRRKFQLIAWAKKDGEETDRLVLLDVHTMSVPKYFEEQSEQSAEHMEAAIQARRMTVRVLVNGDNEDAFRRAFMLMSHYDRRSSYSSRDKVYEMVIHFYDFDREELVKDLLSLGTSVIVCKKDAQNRPSAVYKSVIECIRKGIELNT